MNISNIFPFAKDFCHQKLLNFLMTFYNTQIIRSLSLPMLFSVVLRQEDIKATHSPRTEKGFQEKYENKIVIMLTGVDDLRKFGIRKLRYQVGKAFKRICADFARLTIHQKSSHY